MYNGSQKRDFLNEIGATENAIYVFDSAEKYEEAWGGDLSTMPREELINMVEHISSSRYRSSVNILSICKKYIIWCLSKNIEGTQDCVFNIKMSEIQNLSKTRDSMVASPRELERYMNLIFNPESDETPDNIYRCFLWFAFSGIFNRNEVVKIKGSDVDLDSGIITYNENEYIIYPESQKVINFLLSTKGFYIKNGEYTEGWYERYPGNLLLRGIALPNIGNIKDRVSHKIGDAVNQGLTTKRLSYKRVWLSGVFYRQYMLEKAGADVDFTDIAVQMIKDSKGYDPEKPINRNLFLGKRSQLKHDYITWKKAFDL